MNPAHCNSIIDFRTITSEVGSIENKKQLPSQDDRERKEVDDEERQQERERERERKKQSIQLRMEKGKRMKEGAIDK